MMKAMMIVMRMFNMMMITQMMITMMMITMMMGAVRGKCIFVMQQQRR